MSRWKTLALFATLGFVATAIAACGGGSNAPSQLPTPSTVLSAMPLPSSSPASSERRNAQDFSGPPPSAPAAAPAPPPNSLTAAIIRIPTPEPDALGPIDAPPPQRPVVAVPVTANAQATLDRRALGQQRKPQNSIPSGDLNYPTPPGTATQQHAAMGVLWAGSNLQGYEDYIPFPWEDGYQYTPSGDAIYISSSPQADPTSCVEFGIELSGTLTEFYAYNQCHNGNYTYGSYLPAGPVANQQITQSLANKYTNQSNGEALVLEEVMSDGIHVYIWDYSTSTWDDALGYGVTGSDSGTGGSAGLWLATEHYLNQGTCPSNQQWYAYVDQVNSGSGWTAPSSGSVAVSFGQPSDCLDWWPSGDTWSPPVLLMTPLYSTTGYYLQEPGCQPDSYGYCAEETGTTGSGSCWTYHVVHGEMVKVYEYPPLHYDYSILTYSGVAGTAVENMTYSSPGCGSTSTWTPADPKVTYSDPNLP